VLTGVAVGRSEAQQRLVGFAGGEQEERTLLRADDARHLAHEHRAERLQVALALHAAADAGEVAA